MTGILYSNCHFREVQFEKPRTRKTQKKAQRDRTRRPQSEFCETEKLQYCCQKKNFTHFYSMASTYPLFIE